MSLGSLPLFASLCRAFGWVYVPTPPRCPARQELSKWRPAAALATPVSRPPAPATAAVPTSGSGTPAPVNLVSEQSDGGVGFMDTIEVTVVEGGDNYVLRPIPSLL